MMRSIRALAALALLAAAPAAEPAPLCGLVLMGDIAFHRTNGGEAMFTLDPLAQDRDGLFGGVVINVGWAQVQRTPGTLDGAPIDRALAAIRIWNRQHPLHPLGARLRVWPGASAPQWAKTIGGDPVQLTRGTGGVAFTVPHFWDRRVAAAWRVLMQQLALRYDDEPLIREVTNSSCASLTDEPFIVPSDPDGHAALVRAGFSDAAYRACLAQSVDDYAGWHHAAIEWPLGALVRFDTGAAVPDNAATTALAAAFRARLGARAILANHALAPAADRAARGLAPTYALLARAGPPIALQTANPHAPWLAGGALDWQAAIGDAAALGAGSVELWGHSGRDPGFAGLAPDALRALAADLATGHACHDR